MKKQFIVEVLALIIFTSLLNAVTVLAVPTFSDGFETGDLTAWTGTQLSGASTIAANSTIFNEGSYSAKSVLDAWSQSAYVYKTVAAASEYYARCYVYMVSWGDYDGRDVKFLSLGAGANWEQFGVGVDFDGTKKWIVDYNDNGVDQQLVLNTDAPSQNTWYCIELYVKIHATDGEVKFYLDGVEKLSDSGLDTDNWGDIDRFCVGCRSELGPYVAHTAFVDDAVIDTSYIGLTNTAPSNVDCDVYNADDTDNFYAQYRTYVVTANVTDVDGFADFVTVDLTLQTGAAVERVTFRYTEATNAFSELSGTTTAWELVTASCTQTKAGNDIDLTFYFRAEWNATEEADLDLKVVSTDAAAATDTDTYDVNVDVITNIIATILEGDDTNTPDRQDVGSTALVTGTVRYVTAPGGAVASTRYPPDAEFTSIALHDALHNVEFTDNAIVNGEMAGVLTLNATVCADTYHMYIAMADASYTDADETAESEVIIQDQVRLLTLTQSQAAPESGASVTYRATADLAYDAHPLGNGDSLVLEGLTFAWDSGTSTFEALRSATGPSTFTLNDYTSGNENTYGITEGTMSALSVVTVWQEPTGGSGGGGGGGGTSYTEPPPATIVPPLEPPLPVVTVDNSTGVWFGPWFIPIPTTLVPYYQMYGSWAIIAIIGVVFVVSSAPKQSRKKQLYDALMPDTKEFQRELNKGWRKLRKGVDWD